MTVAMVIFMVAAICVVGTGLLLNLTGSARWAAVEASALVVIGLIALAYIATVTLP